MQFSSSVKCLIYLFWLSYLKTEFEIRFRQYIFLWYMDDYDEISLIWNITPALICICIIGINKNLSNLRIKFTWKLKMVNCKWKNTFYYTHFDFEIINLSFDLIGLLIDAHWLFCYLQIKYNLSITSEDIWNSLWYWYTT